MICSLGTGLLPISDTGLSGDVNPILSTMPVHNNNVKMHLECLNRYCLFLPPPQKKKIHFDDFFTYGSQILLKFKLYKKSHRGTNSTVTSIKLAFTIDIDLKLRFKIKQIELHHFLESSSSAARGVQYTYT